MTNNLQRGYISPILASQITQQLKGYPTEDRVVIISPSGETTTSSGIIITAESSKELPRKGTIIQIGHISEHNESFNRLKIGDLVTYGLYAGKELEMDIDLKEFDMTKYVISVLSLTEIIYIENQ